MEVNAAGGAAGETAFVLVLWRCRERPMLDKQGKRVWQVGRKTGESPRREIWNEVLMAM